MQCQKHTAAPNKQYDENTLTLATSWIIIYTYFDCICMCAMSECVCMRLSSSYSTHEFIFCLFISYFGDRKEHTSLEKMVPMTNSCDYPKKKKGEKHTVKHTQNQRHLSTHIKVNFVLVQMVYVCTERWIYIPRHAYAYTMNPIFLRCRLRLRCFFFSLIFFLNTQNKKSKNAIAISRSVYTGAAEKKGRREHCTIYLLCDGICGRLLARWMYTI